MIDLFCTANSHVVTLKYITVPAAFEGIYSASQKIRPLFPKWLGIFSSSFTHLLHVLIYAGLQNFIQLSATLTKLHHIMLKMSTVGWNACWVIALNMA